MPEQTKEQIYDSQISPLVGQVLELCQKHGIAMIAQFQLGDDLLVSSILPDGDEENPPTHMIAAKILGMP